MFTCPLTPQQKRLWIEWKLNPDGHYYNINAQFRLCGALDVKRFRASLEKATRFFEAFRTGFSEEHGIPQQVIMPHAPLALEYVDLTHDASDSDHNDQKARELLTAKPREPIHLLQDPALRFCLIKVSERVHYFIMINAHILSDGLSAKLVFEALSAVYNDDKQTVEKFRKNATLSVVDYANTYDQETPLHAEYWQRVLEGASLNLRVGSGKAGSRQGARHYFALDAAEYKSVKQLARKERATLFAVLGSIFGVFLSRHFGLKDIVFTYPVNIRPSAMSRMFGFYVSNVPLRIQIQDDSTFSDMIASTMQSRRADRKHETCSVDEIVKQLRKSGKEVPDFPFNISLGQTSFSLDCLNLDGINVEPLRCDPAETHADLSLQYDGTTSALGFYWEYKTELFSEADIAYLSDSFRALILGAVHAPESLVADMPILSKAQQADIVSKSQGMITPYNRGRIRNSYQSRALQSPFDYSVTDPIETEALRLPKNIALKTIDSELTYAELDARANVLARHLIGLGVTNGRRVALFMERSQDLVIAIIAILRTGAAYVPIDPTHPHSRIMGIIKDCRPHMTLTSTRHMPALSGLAAPVCCVDGPEVRFQLQHYSIHNPLKALDPHGAACIIYTSGSSGKPKGVVVSHRNINARISWLQKTMRMGAHNSFLQTINTSFDPSIYEILWPLSVGATLVLPEAGAAGDPVRLARMIDEEQISHMTFVPSLLQTFIKTLKPAQCKSLQHVICGGEVLPPSLVKAFGDKIPAQLYNVYGPTETTILASCYKCNNALAEMVPIGQPLDDTSIYIVSEKHKLQPIGVTGEIYIGGAGVSSGYWARAQLTKERFIADPFSDLSGATLYRTGDLGRYLPNGMIEFVGRIDEQVKIRGFRIELGEIEHAMTSMKGVNQSATMVNHTAAGKHITGYYAPNHISPDALRRHLESLLPHYMVPSAFVALSHMPVTANGKIDKSVLSRTEGSGTARQSVRPQNNTEKRLQAIFVELLRVRPESVGVTDKFFEIGGDSLQSVELALMIEKAFNVNLPSTIIFEYPTVQLLAQYLERHERPVVSRSPIRTNLAARISRQKHLREKHVNAPTIEKAS